MTQENIPLQSGEEITSIQGYEGLYSVTFYGRVWSHLRCDSMGRKQGGKFLKPQLDKDNYLYVILYNNTKYKLYKIHRLVAVHYISNLDDSPEVNHGDGNKQNNCVGNLEWCTKQRNMTHAAKNGLTHFAKSSKYRGTSYCKNIKGDKKWASSITIENEYRYIGHYRTEIEAAKAYNNYIVEYNLDRFLNKINEEEYLKAVEETKRLIKNRGVYHYKSLKNVKNPWGAKIYLNKKQIYLGAYKTEIEALQAYNNYIIKNKLNRPLNNIGGY